MGRKKTLTKLTADPTNPTGEKATGPANLARIFDFVPVLGKGAFLWRTTLGRGEIAQKN
jgi:hypothetical protein